MRMTTLAHNSLRTAARDYYTEIRPLTGYMVVWTGRGSWSVQPFYSVTGVESAVNDYEDISCHRMTGGEGSLVADSDFRDV
jgi:hypothetical protein